MPSSRARSTTGRKRPSDSAIVQLMFFCEKPSEAEAKTAISEVCWLGVVVGAGVERYEVSPCMLGVR